MGRKVNPNLFRIVNNDFSSSWCVDDVKNAPFFILEDKKIRDFCEKNCKSALISNVKISRQRKLSGDYDLVICVHAVYPNMIIGQNEEGLKKIKEKLKKDIIHHGNFVFNVVKIEEPDLNARVLAKKIVNILEKRGSSRKAQKKIISLARAARADGCKTSISGRINGAEIARKESYKKGSIPLQTISKDIDYACETAHTKYGTLGVKVWLNKKNKNNKNDEQSVKYDEIAKD